MERTHPLMIVLLGSFLSLLNSFICSRNYLYSNNLLATEKAEVLTLSVLLHHGSHLDGLANLNATDHHIPSDHVLNSSLLFRSFNDSSLIHSSNSSAPTNLRLAFLGDSLMRYQYLSLIFYLHTGRWVTDTDDPNLMCEKTFENWQHFMMYSTAQLDGKEICDCYRNPGRLDHNTSYENRHYSGRNNNSVSFIRKSGKFISHGHFRPQDAFRPRLSWQYDQDGQQPALWEETDWTGVIRNYIAQLNPKPKYLVLNAGMWPHDLNITTFADIRRTLDHTGILGIYKTTTRRWREGPGVEPHDAIGCKVLHYCFDVSWTGDIRGSKYYWDLVHFRADVNRRFNEQFLRLLDDIESGVIKPNDSSLVGMNVSG